MASLSDSAEGTSGSFSHSPLKRRSDDQVRKNPKNLNMQPQQVIAGGDSREQLFIKQSTSAIGSILG